jgi:hypothetical protein
MIGFNFIEVERRGAEVALDLPHVGCLRMTEAEALDLAAALHKAARGHEGKLRLQGEPRSMLQ